MDEEHVLDMSSKLDKITKLLLAIVIDGKDFTDQVFLLSSVGFQPKDIAEMLGKTPNHIRVKLHEIKKGKAFSEPDESDNETQVNK